MARGQAARGQPACLSSLGPRDTRCRWKPPGTPHREKWGGQGEQGPSRSGTRSEGRQCAGAQDRPWGHPAAPLRPRQAGSTASTHDSSAVTRGSGSGASGSWLPCSLPRRTMSHRV